MIVEKGLTVAFVEEKLARRTNQQREPKRFKGERMEKQNLRILLAVVCFVGLGVTAAAQGRGEIVVTLPFEFVANGKTLSAGTYTLSRISDDKFDGLLLTSHENRASVFVHAIEIESVRADKPNVSFERVGEQHFLTRIQTTNHVYNIPVSRSATMEAAMRSHDGRSTSGSSGNN